MFAVVCAASPARVRAQQTGSISGTVTDPDGNVIPNASVVVNQASAGISRKLISDAEGRFRADQLPAGTYTVDVTSRDFSNPAPITVMLGSGQLQTLSIKLNIGRVGEQVTVSAD